MKLRKILVQILVLFLLSASYLRAEELSLPPIFSDHMVFQQNAPISIYGKADPGKRISVIFGPSRKTVVADKSGNWRAILPARGMLKTGADLKVSDGKSTKIFKDILIGEVWICSGQSNMRWMVKQSSEANEIAGNSSIPQIRLIDFTGTLYPDGTVYPADTIRNLTPGNYFKTEGWQQASPETAATFSAVAWIFGRKLYDELNCPIGLIHNSIGGALTESWISPEALKAESVLKPLTENWLESNLMGSWCRGRAELNLREAIKEKVSPLHHPFEPGFLFEAGIRPLTSYSIRGAIWYQGESNCPDSPDGEYTGAHELGINKLKLVTLIRDWRNQFKNPQLPFYYVQLPKMNRNWSLYREMQDNLLDEIPGIGMAVTIDTGDPGNVHPKSKKAVGERLALQALSKTYKKNIAADSPRFDRFEKKGNRILLAFKHCEGGLKADGEVKGFEIAGKDGNFVRAEAKITGKETVEVFAESIGSPEFVRYCWSNVPDGNVTNGAGLPMTPFRTD